MASGTGSRGLTRREALALAGMTAWAGSGSWKIGIAQITLSDGLARNQKKILEYIREAASQRCRVVVFPEGALSAASGPTSPEIDQCLSEIREAAAAGEIHVLVGGKSNAPGESRSRNWMVVVDAAGKQALWYDKLYDRPEARMPGVFSMDAWECSAIICADRWLRGIEELPIMNGARISFELSNNYDNEWVPELGWYWYVPRAIRNGAYVVLANTSGPGKHGHSAVIGPDGSMIAAAENREGLVTATIDPVRASRAEAIRRQKHPLLSSFWDEGRRVLKSGSGEVQPVKQYLSPEIEVRLAVAQMACSRKVEANVARMVAMIRKAAEGGADAIVFPELAVTGAREEDVLGAGAGALRDALTKIRETAQSAKICTVFGMPHHENGRTTNAAFAIGPDGGILTRYDQLAVDRQHLFQPGTGAASMWFRVKGVPGVVTIGHDGLWSEIAELASLAGGQLHFHIANDPSTGKQASLRRLQIWANLASWATFTTTVNAASPEGLKSPSAPADGGSAIWEDLRRREESNLAKVGQKAPGHERMSIYSPFSANCLVRAGSDEQILFAKERMNLSPEHRSARFNPRMEAWYSLGARLFAGPLGF